jgi:hypothetical protein
MNLHSCLHHTAPPVNRGYLELWFRTNQPHCSCTQHEIKYELRTSADSRDSFFGDVIAGESNSSTPVAGVLLLACHPPQGGFPREGRVASLQDVVVETILTQYTFLQRLPSR